MQDFRQYSFLGIAILIITEIPGYHKEKRHRTSCQYFYKLPGLSRKAYMDAYHQARSNGLYSIQTFISHLISHPPFSVVSSIAAEQSVNV